MTFFHDVGSLRWPYMRHGSAIRGDSHTTTEVSVRIITVKRLNGF